MVNESTFRDLCKACEVKDVLTGGTLYFVDGMDHAICGIGVRSGKPCIVYDRVKVMDRIMETNNCSYREAEEVMAERIEGVSVGRSTPVFIIPCEAKHIRIATECRIPKSE